MKVNIQEIIGPWHKGYTLDKHTIRSDYLGENEYGRPMFDTIRSEVGEAIYQLKYRDDHTMIKILTDTFVDNLSEKLKSISLIIPVPPSKERKFQPLLELAKNISNIMDKPYFDNILIKNSKTSQMKDIQNSEEKKAKLLDSFEIYDGIENKGKWDVLLIDDLYSSGSSLESAAIKLNTYSKINKIHVAAFTRTK